jgi:hypothetical protein
LPRSFFYANVCGMNTPHQIIDALTAEAVASRLGITKEAVGKALKAGKLPAPWFDTLERMAGCELPRHVFTFKGEA